MTIWINFDAKKVNFDEMEEWDIYFVKLMVKYFISDLNQQLFQTCPIN